MVTAPSEIYTLSLHDALPISDLRSIDEAENRDKFENLLEELALLRPRGKAVHHLNQVIPTAKRSEEHTSELQSRGHLVCRLLLEKKKTAYNERTIQRSI